MSLSAETHSETQSDGPQVRRIRLWQAFVEEAVGLPPGLLISKSKIRLCVELRAAVMLVMRQRARRSYPEIGRAMNRHHTTVLHDVRKIERRLKNADPRATAVVKLVYRIVLDCERSRQASAATKAAAKALFADLQSKDVSQPPPERPVESIAPKIPLKTMELPHVRIKSQALLTAAPSGEPDDEKARWLRIKKMRALGWSVNALARRFDVPAELIAQHLGVAWGNQEQRR